VVGLANGFGTRSSRQAERDKQQQQGEGPRTRTRTRAREEGIETRVNSVASSRFKSRRIEIRGPGIRLLTRCGGGIRYIVVHWASFSLVGVFGRMSRDVGWDVSFGRM